LQNHCKSVAKKVAKIAKALQKSVAKIAKNGAKPL
jgi:hypothetical protein